MWIFDQNGYKGDYEFIFLNEKKKHYHQELEQKFGKESLGYMSGKRWREDPRGLLFSLSRYKFVSKILEGKMMY